MATVKFALVQAHSNNIDRYHRLLKTRLTDVERHYIELRLSEEQAALQAIDPPQATITQAISGQR